ncbi:hypothetical protein [Enterobacter bugandensis]|uniref:hypothetical protein n=1 Tax=Enterobacter bugandensis TaxID=881260 RepID=UPI0010A4ED31|nr:hypothetical protein [Enterobacter bugandensis]
MARQNGSAELAENDGSLSRITSTAASDETDPKPKLKVHCLTRLEVATRCIHRALIYMSRAPRFIPRRGLKSKTKIRVLPAASGKISSSHFNAVRDESKKTGNRAKK